MTLYITLVALGLAAYALNEFAVTRDLRPIAPTRKGSPQGRSVAKRASTHRFAPVPTGIHLGANLPSEANPVSLTRKLSLPHPVEV